jgi:hypothetical protein
VPSLNRIALGIAPTVSIVEASKPMSGTVIREARFDWTIGGGGADTVECSLDGRPFTECIGQFAQAYGAARLTTGPSGVNHTFSVRVTNAVSTATDSHPWKIEPLPPTLTMQSGPADPTTATTATFGWTIGGGGAASVACMLDGATVGCSETGVSLPALTTDADGVTHRLTVLVTNTNPTKPMASSLSDWEVRPLAPVLSGLAVTPGDGELHGAFTLTFAVAADTTSITCQLDTASSVPCTSGQAFADPGPDHHTMTVNATNITGSDTQQVEWTYLADDEPIPPPESDDVRFGTR